MMFSIIIPVFNVEPFLRQALESVMQQDFEDFQAVLVNDGSTDGCLAICRTFEQADRRVILIDQVNRGVSAARNAGLERATGEYILFLDGDDFMEPGALAVLAEFLSRCPGIDLVTCAHQEFRDEGDLVLRRVPHGHDVQPLARHDYLERLRAGRIIPWAVWKNVFRTEVIRRWNLGFDPALVRAEDALFYAEFVHRAETFGTLQAPIVNYRVGHSTSAMQQVSPSHLRSRISVRITLFGGAQKAYESGQGDFRTELAEVFAGDVSDLWQIKDRRSRAELLELVRTHAHILRYVRSRRLRFFRLLTRLFGIYGASLVYRELRTFGRNVQQLIRSPRDSVRLGLEALRA